MKIQTNRVEVMPSYYNSLAASALRGILPRIKGNLIQKDNKLFLDKKNPTFLGKPIMVQNLPEEFIVE